jgi:hypothetical protein
VLLFWAEPVEKFAPRQQQTGERLGCPPIPMVSLRFGDGLIFRTLYVEGQHQVLARASAPRWTFVTLSP